MLILFGSYNVQWRNKMKKILWIVLAFIFIAGCKENNVEAPSTTKEEK